MDGILAQIPDITLDLRTSQVETIHRKDNPVDQFTPVEDCRLVDFGKYIRNYPNGPLAVGYLGMNGFSVTSATCPSES